MGRRSFSPEFKLEAIKLLRQRGVTVAQAVRDTISDNPRGNKNAVWHARFRRLLKHLLPSQIHTDRGAALGAGAMRERAARTASKFGPTRYRWIFSESTRSRPEHFPRCW